MDFLHLLMRQERTGTPGCAQEGIERPPRRKGTTPGGIPWGALGQGKLAPMRRIRLRPQGALSYPHMKSPEPSNYKPPG